MFRWLTIAAVACWLVILVGCHGPEGAGLMVRVPLLDPEHQPDLLVERQLLELPTSTGGNRFLTGWRPHGNKKYLVSTGRRVRLEVVSLEPRQRTLVLETRSTAPAPAPAPGQVVVASTGERYLGTVPLGPRLELPLPADLPIGRISIDLTLPEGVELTASTARVTPCHTAGKVTTDQGAVAQRGWSALDQVRWVAAGTVLEGSFQPPLEARPGQRFRCLIQRQDEAPRPVLTWSAAGDRPAPPLPFSIALGETPGLVRVRLLATGSGPPGRWQGLQLSTPDRAKPPPEAVPAAPSLVVLYVMDSLRADALGHLGGRADSSPVLDQLATEGVSFTNHLAVAPSTLPSTKALLSGQVVLQGRKLPADGPPTLAQIFAGAGYSTACFSGNGFVAERFGTTRGFQVAELTVLPAAEADSEYNDSAERVQRAALAWLREQPAGQPAFLYLHTVNPHCPYDPPQPFRSRLSTGQGSTITGSAITLLRLRDEKIVATAADQQRLRDLYLGSLAYNDAQLPGFLDELQRRYPDGELLVALTSDHGEELFDHGGVLHGDKLYEELLRLPLVLWWPDRVQPRQVHRPTTTLDLHHSLRALVDPAVELGRTFWGSLQEEARSLRRPLVRFAATSAGVGVFMARSDRYKLIWAPRKGRFGMGRGLGEVSDPVYLFDLATDPGERHNLAGSSRLEEAWLRSLLLAWITRNNRPLPKASEPVELEEPARRQLEALGYMEPAKGR